MLLMHQNPLVWYNTKGVSSECLLLLTTCLFVVLVLEEIYHDDKT